MRTCSHPGRAQGTGGEFANIDVLWKMPTNQLAGPVLIGLLHGNVENRGDGHGGPIAQRCRVTSSPRIRMRREHFSGRCQSETN